MNTTDKAHNILATALRVYDHTGWCKAALVITDADAAEQRCLNGALSVGIVMNCSVGVPVDLDDEDYPSDLWGLLDDKDQDAIGLAFDRLRTVLVEGDWAWADPLHHRSFLVDAQTAYSPDNADVSYIENAIVAWNDDAARTREDVLLALEKAVANT